MHQRSILVALAFIIAACGRSEGAVSSGSQNPMPVAGPSNGWVAFAAVDGMVSTAGSTGPADIYLVSEGQPVRPLVGSEGDGRHQFCPAFSPDGSRLAYVDMPFGPKAPPGPRGIVIVGFDGELDSRDGKTVIEVGPSDEVVIDNFAVSCPKWSPDGSSVAYMEDYKLRVATLGAQPPSVVCLSCTCLPLRDCQVVSFAWSPDGSVIAVARREGIALVPVDGGAWRLLPANPPLGTSNISWSSDGTRLVADGPTLDCRPSNPACPADGPDPSVAKVIGIDGTVQDLSSDGESPIWSPDGSRIAYLAGDTRTLVVSLPDGSARRELPVPDPHLPGRPPVRSGDWRPGFATGLASWPIWSPDSTRLLYVTVGVDGYALVSVSATHEDPPVFLTPFDFLLYNTGSSWMSWQPVLP